MADFDYSTIVATAAAQISRFGRTITLVSLGNVPGDISKPWLGALTPRTVVAAQLVVKSVFVEPSSLEELGRNVENDDFVKRSTQIGLIYSPDNLRIFNEVIDDDTSRWRIQGMSELRPATDRVLWFVGVSR